MTEDLFAGCAEELATTPELVRQLLRDHVATVDGWCRAHSTHLEPYPCSIRLLAELAMDCMAAHRAGRMPV